MSTNVYRSPVLQPYQIVRLLPFWERCWRTGSRRQPLRRRNLCTRERAHEDFVDTVCAYIEIGFSGFCWAFQSFRKRCYQHQNRTTGAALLHSIPQNNTSPQAIGAAEPWKATFWPLWERYANIKAIRPETCQSPTLRRLYNIFQLFPEMKQLKTKRIRQTLRTKANVRKRSENHEYTERLRDRAANTWENLRFYKVFATVELFTLVYEMSVKGKCLQALLRTEMLVFIATLRKEYAERSQPW